MVEGFRPMKEAQALGSFRGALIYNNNNNEMKNPNSPLTCLTVQLKWFLNTELHIHKRSGHTLTKRSTHNGGSDKRGDTSYTQSQTTPEQ